MEFSAEMIERAKQCACADEILTMAREHGIEITPETANHYYACLHSDIGEIGDEELQNVSGGGCQTSVGGKKYVVVTSMTPCFTGQHEQNFPHEWYAFQSSEICALNSHVTHGQFANPYDPVYTKDNVGLRKLWSSYCCSWGEGGKRVHSCGDCRYLCFKGGLGYCGVS